MSAIERVLQYKAPGAYKWVDRDANAIRTYLADGMIQHGTIAVSAGAADQFKTTTTLIYSIGGTWYSKAATDALEFSAVDTINVGAAALALWGAWLLEIGTDGTPHTKPAGGLADQVYASEALALAALPAITAAHIQYGIITVQNTVSAAFTANTTHLHVADVAAVNFYNLPAVRTLPAAL